MPQNLGGRNAPTASLARPRGRSTGLQAKGQEGSLLWPHTSGSSRGRTLPVPWPGTNSLCPPLCVGPLAAAPHHEPRAQPAAVTNGHFVSCPLPWLQGGFSQVPALLGGEPRQAGAGRVREQSLLAVTVPLLLCPLCCHLCGFALLAAVGTRPVLRKETDLARSCCQLALSTCLSPKPAAAPAEVPALCHSSRPALSLFAPREISEKFPWVSVALGSCLQGGHQPGCAETPPGGAWGTPELPALLALVLWMEVTGELFVYCPPQEQGAAEEHPVLPWASPSRGIFPSLSEPCAMAVVTGQGSTASTCWQIIPTG